MARLFDAYIMVDWSAAAKPATGANSVWIGILARDARLKFQFRAVNPDTRTKARAFLVDMIGKLLARGDKVLLGFDFALGYPAGTADAANFDTEAVPPWQAMFEFLSSRLKEREDNSRADERFAVAASLNYKISGGQFPFWGAMSQRHQSATLGQKKTAFDSDRAVAEHRMVESMLRKQPGATPKTVWQLGGQGSVGSQSLMGIPHVATIKSSFEGARLWPFELGLDELTDEGLQGVNLVITEIYPSLIPTKPAPGTVLDAAQVETMARHYCDLDGKDRLGALFMGPEGKTEAEMSQIQAEEGWILGI
ncbi:MAG: hypothetical protein AAF216_14160 [Pseudomonadota bacterium]